MWHASGKLSINNIERSFCDEANHNIDKHKIFVNV